MKKSSLIELLSCYLHSFSCKFAHTMQSISAVLINIGTFTYIHHLHSRFTYCTLGLLFNCSLTALCRAMQFTKQTHCWTNVVPLYLPCSENSKSKYISFYTTDHWDPYDTTQPHRYTVSISDPYRLLYTK